MAKKKKSKRRTSKLDRNRVQHLLSALLVFGGLFVGWQYYKRTSSRHGTPLGDRAGKAAAENFYSQEVQRAAEKYDLDYGYLMALLMLECSGKKTAGARFEPHVFNRLKQVRDGKRTNYENVTAAHLADASDDALRNLATSWGPFQLMGYKCILLDVNIRDIRGPNGMEHGADWINQTYGQRDATRPLPRLLPHAQHGPALSRTGLPKTHDPQYVPRGMSMMKQFAPPTAHATPLSHACQQIRPPSLPDH